MANFLKSIRYSWLLILLTLTSQAQILYKTTRRADGTLVNYRESVAGSGNFDLQISGALPSDAVPYKGGGRVLNPYTLEPNGTLNLAQFGLDKYYSPNFHFQVDFGGWESVDQRRRYGINTFGLWNVADEHKAQLRAGEGFYFLTENFLGDQASGHGFNMESLQTFFSKVWNKVPAMGYGEFAKYGFLNFNIENAITLDPGNIGSPLPGFPNGYYNSIGNPDWNSVKGNSIQMETTGEWVTLEQLASRGYTAWYNEFYSRLATRMILVMEIAKAKRAPGVKISSGSPIRVSQPNRDDQTASNTWIGNNGYVEKIGGDSQGNITLTKPDGSSFSTNLSGCLYDHEDFLGMALVRPWTEFSAQDWSDIFVDKKPGTQNYPYVWSKEKTIGIVAEEKGLLQHQRQRMRARLKNHTAYPIKREQQLFYESRNYVLPFAELQNLHRFGDGFTDTPRLWHSPLNQYARYVVTRFMAGDEPDWGFHLFPQSQYDCLKNPLTYSVADYRKFYNHPLHPISAMFQARADMQPYETFYPGSTFVEDPDVNIGADGGAFVNYNGIVAYDTYPNPQKPAYMLRYKAVPGGYRVVIVGGIQQGFTDEHIDLVRVPNGGLNGAKFKMKLTGPGAHVYEFFVASADSNLTYEALPISVPSRTMTAYPGWIINNN